MSVSGEKTSSSVDDYGGYDAMNDHDTLAADDYDGMRIIYLNMIY